MYAHYPSYDVMYKQMLLHEAIGTRSKDPGNYPAMIMTIRAHVPLDYLNGHLLDIENIY